jgi:mono/diheme cytochrome c family protein
MRSGSGAPILVSILVAGCLSDIPADGYDGTPAAAPQATDDGSQPPTFGPTVTQNDPPPPISGGTLAATHDGTVVVADPDRDAVYIVDARARSSRTVNLAPHDEPGRVVIDGGRAFVALRRGGALVTIDLASASVVSRREVCPTPRGVAYDKPSDTVYVACAGGELVTLPLSTRSAIIPASRFVVDDLRDVVVSGDGVVVSTFRSSARWLVPSNGPPRMLYSGIASGDSRIRSQVAWRMIADDRTDDGVLSIAQSLNASVAADSSDWYHAEQEDPCAPGGGQVTVVGDAPVVHVVPNAPLAVDVAATPDFIAMAVAGNGHTPEYPQMILLSRKNGGGCDSGTPVQLPGQITSVGWIGLVSIVAFSREPAALFVLELGASVETAARIDLSPTSREDTGHAIFHSNAGHGAACASCHAEGRDDGHVWSSVDRGSRRTQSLLGTLAGTAPYHWDGEQADMKALARFTFESAMQGPTLANDRIAALEGWLVALPPLAVSPPADPDAVTRGAVRFEASCASCHAGPKHTDNSTRNVGTGGSFQVPSLVGVGWRAPYLHDGAAPSLDEAIFVHNKAITDTTDLIAYLRTL